MIQETIRLCKFLKFDLINISTVGDVMGHLGKMWFFKMETTYFTAVLGTRPC